MLPVLGHATYISLLCQVPLGSLQSQPPSLFHKCNFKLSHISRRETGEATCQQAQTVPIPHRRDRLCMQKPRLKPVPKKTCVNGASPRAKPSSLPNESNAPFLEIINCNNLSGRLLKWLQLIVSLICTGAAR